MEFELVEKIVAIAVGTYEVISRVIPTVKDWSIGGNIVAFLKVVSDFFNSRKKV